MVRYAFPILMVLCQVLKGEEELIKIKVKGVLKFTGGGGDGGGEPS